MSIVSFRERFNDSRSCWVVFIHVVRGRPGGLLLCTARIVQRITQWNGQQCTNAAVSVQLCCLSDRRKDKFIDAEHMLMLAQAEKIRLLTEQVEFHCSSNEY